MLWKVLHSACNMHSICNMPAPGNRVPDELWNEVGDIVQETGICREPAYCILSAALSTASSFRIWNSSTRILSLLGASVRNSARGKGHEEGGSAYAKAGSSLRSPPWKFSSIYPPSQSLPTFCFVLSPTPLTLRGAVPHYLSLKKELAYSSS